MQARAAAPSPERAPKWLHPQGSWVAKMMEAEVVAGLPACRSPGVWAQSARRTFFDRVLLRQPKQLARLVVAVLVFACSRAVRKRSSRRRHTELVAPDALACAIRWLRHRGQTRRRRRFLQEVDRRADLFLFARQARRAGVARKSRPPEAADFPQLQWAIQVRHARVSVLARK